MSLCTQNIEWKSWINLSILTLVYLVGELSHFLLGTVTRPMSQDLHYGDQACLSNPLAEGVVGMPRPDCYQANSSDFCDEMGQSANITACTWDYSGLGVDYQILAGPAFVAVFTTSGVVIAMVSDRYSRKLVVTTCLLLLTTSTILTGLATSYWHLVILRMLVGAGESSFAPACSSMISNMFPQSYRALALGIFNWGIYLGYGLAYAIGNFVTVANIGGLGWRWSYFISGMIGLVVFILMIIIVTEPSRSAHVQNDPQPTTEVDLQAKYSNSFDKIGQNDHQQAFTAEMKHKPNGKLRILPDNSVHPYMEQPDEKLQKKSVRVGLFDEESRIRVIVLSFFKPSIIMLCLSACVRHTGGFTWAYNTQLYFSTYYPDFNLGVWVTWVSIVGGSLGVAIGGFVSDKFVKKIGLRARLYVLAGSQFLATPFAAGVLYFEPPGAFYSLLVAYLFAEMWFGVLFAVLLDLIPSNVKSTAIAVFIFIMNNVGGNLPLVVEPLREAWSYRAALLIMYPGCYLLSSILFFITSFLVEKKVSR